MRPGGVDMARYGALAALALFLILARSGLAEATILECPSEEWVVGKGSAAATSAGSVLEARDKAIDRAGGQMDAWHKVHDGEYSCRPAPEPCSLTVFDRESVDHSGDRAHGWAATAEWTMLAVCRKTARGSGSPGGVSHFVPPPAGGSTSAGAGSPGGATTTGKPQEAPPLVDCTSCEQLQLELNADQAKLAASEGEERTLTGKVKSAQVLGQPTGGLEAQLAGNASDQASLRALIRVVETKLQHCPKTCQQPNNPWRPR